MQEQAIHHQLVSAKDCNDVHVMRVVYMCGIRCRESSEEFSIIQGIKFRSVEILQ